MTNLKNVFEISLDRIKYFDNLNSSPDDDRQIDRQTDR